MIRATVLCCSLCVAALLPIAPAAATQRARPTRIQRSSLGGVAASFRFSGSYPDFSRQRLKISVKGRVVYDEPVSSRFCGHRCAPLSSVDRRDSVRVAELEGAGSPSVVLGLYTGGAHCCTVLQVLYRPPGGSKFVLAERELGDPIARIEDLSGTGRDELLTANDAFAYTFTDYAASGLPLQILSFSKGRFHVVTRQYPALIESDAEMWLDAYGEQRKRHYEDTVGLIAAWAADEDELGHAEAVAAFLAEQAKAGHLNSPLSPVVPSGGKFVAKLDRFLRKLGYLE